MKIIHFSAICSLTAILSACGDGTTNVQEPPELSSSSHVLDKSSSSSIESSSSNIAKPVSSSEHQSASSSSSSHNSTNYNPETGLLTDERDGKIYETTKIENQIWMAENLNFDIRDYKNTIIADIDEFMGENNGYKNETRCPKSGTEDDCNAIHKPGIQSVSLLRNPEVPDLWGEHGPVCNAPGHSILWMDLRRTLYGAWKSPGRPDSLPSLLFQ